MKDNSDVILQIFVKIIIFILLLICIFNGSKISDFIYNLNTEGFIDFEVMRIYMSVQIILSLLSILDIGLIVIDYYRLSKKS